MVPIVRLIYSLKVHELLRHTSSDTFPLHQSQILLVLYFIYHTIIRIASLVGSFRKLRELQLRRKRIRWQLFFLQNFSEQIFQAMLTPTRKSFVMMMENT